MKKDIKKVLDKVSSGNASPEEETMARLWLHQLHQNDEAALSEAELNEVSDEMWASLEKNRKQSSPGTGKLWPYISAAASLVLVGGMALYFYKYQRSAPVKAAQQYSNDVPAVFVIFIPPSSASIPLAAVLSRIFFPLVKVRYALLLPAGTSFEYC